MKLKSLASFFKAKFVISTWLLLVTVLTLFAVMNYFDVANMINNPGSGTSVENTALLFSALGMKLVLLAILLGVGIVFALKIMGAPASTQTVKRLQQYIDNPNAFRQGLKDDGNGKQAELFKLIDLVILNATNKLDRVEDAGSILAGAASEMSYDAKDLSDEMQKQYSSIHQVATAVNEMTATVQEVANNTVEASSATESARVQAQDGALQSTNAMGAIEKLEGEIQSATEVFEQVKQESANIGGVLDVIRGVAEQTNLLALNAAIEAARAGEQGRGFAVVADEVRTLATRTSDSTEEIESMVKSLNQKTTEAAEKMEKATEQAALSVESVEMAAMALGEIAGSIHNINDMNQQVAEATKQQSEVSEDINRNVTAIQQITETVVESSSEISETSERVLREVSSLNKLVKM